MTIAKIFRNGKSQAVRLPKAFRFKGDRVHIKRMGEAVVLLPYQSAWSVLFESLTMFSDDFMVARNQPPIQKRELLFK